MKTVFITGGSGYMGKRLIRAMLEDGRYVVKALVRKGSEGKIPEGCKIVYGDALDAQSYKGHVPPASIFIHLVGVAHPSPKKKNEFKAIDLVSIQQAVDVALTSGIEHFIYLSVAQYPTKIMREYQEVRAEGERLLRTSGMRSSFVRPWYVIGPGHYWPLALKPFYAIARLFPGSRKAANKLDTVTIQEMVNCLMHVVQRTTDHIEVYDVEDIKKFRF
ncbi:MAG: epimerase [Bacteroidetes bacterium]|nr:MAG: epimerase [Bacteroidota bacterium]